MSSPDKSDFFVLATIEMKLRVVNFSTPNEAFEELVQCAKLI